MMNRIVLHGFKAAMALLVLQVALFCAQACGSTAARGAAITVADVVNEVAQRGDVLYGVSVDTCDQAERAAAEQGTPEQAEKLVGAIRARCDEAFRAFDRLRIATERIDAAVDAIGTHPLSARDLSDLALDARRLHAEAADLNAKLGSFLAEWLK